MNYVYPLSTRTDGEVDERVQGTFALNMRVKSEVPIAAMESPSHGDDFMFARHNESFAECSMELSEGMLSDDIVLAYHTSRPHTGVDVLTSATEREDGYFYLTLTPGEELVGAGQNMDYLFVLDISGSMANAGKLNASTKSVLAFIEKLPAGSRFDVMTFNVDPRPLFGELRELTDETRSNAKFFVDNARARGGTVLQSALRAAYNYADPNGDRLLNLVILSDGLTEPEDQQVLLDTSRDRPENTRIFCIGVGTDVNRPVLAQLAEDAGGLAAFVSCNDDFERQAESFRRKLTHPVATDVRIAVEGIETYDVLSTLLPNLYHGTPMRVYGRYRGAGEADVVVRGFVEGQAFEQRIPFVFPSKDDDNPEIERMWASRAIDAILESSRSGGGRTLSDADVGEIVRLGEAYSIVSEYTSFLVLENEAEYQRWKIERRNALRENRDRRAQEKFTQELQAMREAASSNVGPGRQKLARNFEEPEPSTEKRSQSSTPRPVPERSTSRDISITPSGGSRGGGAFDPFTGGLCAFLAASCVAVRRKRDGE